MDRPFEFRPRPVTVAMFLAYAIAAKLLPYLLAKFGMSLDPSSTPYPWNVSPIYAMCLFAGASFPSRRGAFMVPLAAMAIGDLGIGLLTGRWDWVFYPGLLVVYAALVLLIGVGTLLPPRPGLGQMIAAGLGGGTLFYLVTNFAVWASSGHTAYPKTAEGLLACYAAALPFYRNSLIGLAVFLPLFFSPLALAPRPNPIPQPA